MKINDKAQQYHDRMFPNYVSSFLTTDPEFIVFFDNFAFDEVVNQNDLDDKTRFIVILASLIGVQGFDEFKAMLSPALNFGVTPIEIREIVYQSVPYLGIGRVISYLKEMNRFFIEKGIKLPLENQSTTNESNRLEKGIEAQVEIFGEYMRDYYKSNDEDVRHINRWLTESCFGDYYTRGGLDLKTRELITFCFLLSQGDTDNQIKSHIEANIRMGNDKEFLLKVVTQLVPFIGYPRCLNAIAKVKSAN